jgi:CheY-like chemotaxis protein
MIRWPLGRADAARLTKDVIVTSALTLLYVADNAANVRLVDLLLEQRPGLGRLLSTDRGQLGLDLARHHRPATILLDVRLPGTEGADLLRTIRQDPTPVIVLSAESELRFAAQMLAAGAQAYLTKPLDLTEFFAALDAVIPRRAAPSS